MKHGDKIFSEWGTSGKRLQWVDNPEWFQRWKDGQTGMPLVDANMREIKQTGTTTMLLCYYIFTSFLCCILWLLLTWLLWSISFH